MEKQHNCIMEHPLYLISFLALRSTIWNWYGYSCLSWLVLAWCICLHLHTLKKTFFFNWSIVNLQCCVSFRCIEKCRSAMEQVTHSAGHSVQVSYSVSYSQWRSARSPTVQIAHVAGQPWCRSPQVGRGPAVSTYRMSACCYNLGETWKHYSQWEKPDWKCMIPDRKCPEYVDADRVVVDGGCGAEHAVPT